MTGRSVPEWIGSTPNAEIPKAVRLRVFERYGGVCQLSGRKIQVGDKWQPDHRIPLGLRGEHRESNLWPVLVDPHKEKTADDTRAIRKAQRIALKHIGAWPRSKRLLKSRGFQKSRAAEHASNQE